MIKTMEIDENLENKEWELHELIETLSSELDRFEDTLGLKSIVRGITFGLTTAELELNVFVRYDPDKGKIYFRTANADETGYSKIKIDLPSLIRDQIQTHQDIPTEKPDMSPLESLKGIKESDILSLNRLGVFNVSHLKKLAAQSPEIRDEVHNKTAIDTKHISKWLKIPEINEIKEIGNELLISGDNIKGMGDENVFVGGYRTDILETSKGLLRVRLPEDVTEGDVTIVSNNGLSKCVEFTRTTTTSEKPVEAISGVGVIFTKKLNENGIMTVGQLLHLSVDELSDILDLSTLRASNILECARKDIYDKI
ncbi:MAG: hypothetical protein ACT6FC_04630 [Methanosarcinaceae archaeon]